MVYSRLAQIIHGLFAIPYLSIRGENAAQKSLIDVLYRRVFERGVSNTESGHRQMEKVGKVRCGEWGKVIFAALHAPNPQVPSPSFSASALMRCWSLIGAVP